MKQDNWLHPARVTGIVIAVATLAGSLGVAASGVASAATSSDSPIHIGVISDNETPCEEPGQLDTMQSAIKLWASSVNSHGGIKGHPVKLTILNTNCSPGVTVSDANQLISQHVIAIIDNANTNNDYASVVDAAKIPVICGPSTGNSLYCSTDANFYPSGETEIPGAYTLAVAAKKAGTHTYGFLYCTEVSTCEQAVPFIGKEVASVGLGYAHVAASETAPNYTAQCLAMKSAGVDALFVGGPPALTVADNCADQGYHPIYIQGVGTWSTKYLKDPNMNRATGASSDVPWNLANTSVTKAFHKVEGGLLAASVSPYDVSSTYAAGLLLQAALEHAPANPTSAEVTAALQAISGTTLGGFAPPLNFAPGKPTSVPCGFIVSIKDGHWNAPYGAKKFCEPSS